MEIPTKGIFCT